MSRPPLPSRQLNSRSPNNPYALPPTHHLDSLLRVDFIPFTQRRQSTQPLPPLSKPTTSISQKSLESRHTNSSEPVAFKIKVKKELAKSQPKKKEFAKEVMKVQSESVTEGEKREIQSEKGDSVEKKVEESVHNIGDNYVEKKMGIGKKKNNKTLKQFVLETLSKAKGESNCLILHKGTTQAAPSPHLPSAHLPSPHPKLKSPPKQEPHHHIKQPNNIRAIFGQLKRSNQGERNTRLSAAPTTDNKKWVQMARKFQEKHAIPALEIPEQIEEIAEECEQQEGLRNQSIKQEIIVEQTMSPVHPRK